MQIELPTFHTAWAKTRREQMQQIPAPEDAGRTLNWVK
jgi:hypothetical protein